MRTAFASLSLVFFFCLATKVSGQTTPVPGGALTKAEQIRELSPDQASKAKGVFLSGVMVDVSGPDRMAIILADNTAEIYIRAAWTEDTNIFAPYYRGDLLEIQGVTDPGQFAPIVIASSVKKIGTAPIPAARPVSFQQLITGALDGQWVEIKGVVRQCFDRAPQADMQRIVVAADGGLVSARFNAESQEAPSVDSEVRVRAICYYQYNQKRQVLTPILQVPKGETIRIEKSAPENPFAAPLRSAKNLAMFSPENLLTYAHRIHLRGTVTCCPPGFFFWIRDGCTGLRIQTREQSPLQAGDEVDVLGFPSFGSYPPMLADSTFRKTGARTLILPTALTNFNEAFEHDNDLVILDGTLTQIQSAWDGIVLTLEKNTNVFKAFLKSSTNAPPSSWLVGSRVRLAGICALVYDEPRPYAGIWQPKLFQIILRSSSDLAILEPPPWWTVRHMAMLFGISTGALALLTGLVAVLLKHRLLEQKRQRQMAESEFAAILCERNRLAREIHDTLAQSLVATSVQLRLAKKNLNGAAPAVTIHLDAAQQLVRGSLDESRNSIWNRRAQVLEKNDLPGALGGILKQMADGTEIKTDLDVIGCPRRLAPVVENNILRIGQEAITNAAKHSRARHIHVMIEYRETQFYLRVADDGCGFDPTAPPFSDGGFGLIGMQERAGELKGRLTVRSAVGNGAEIALSVPLLKD